MRELGWKLSPEKRLYSPRSGAPSSAVWGWAADGESLQFDASTDAFSGYTDIIGVGGTGLDFAPDGGVVSNPNYALKGTPWSGLDTARGNIDAGNIFEITGIADPYPYHFSFLIAKSDQTLGGSGIVPVQMGGISGDILGTLQNGAGSSQGGNAISGECAWEGVERAAYPTRLQLYNDADWATFATVGEQRTFSVESPGHGTLDPIYIVPFCYTASSLFLGGVKLLAVMAYTDWTQRSDVEAYLKTLLYQGNSGVYRFWRFRCTQNDGDGSGRVTIGDMEMRVSGVDQTDATAANIYGSTYFGTSVPANAFNGNSSNWWTSEFSCTADTTDNGQWVMYDFGAGNSPAIDELVITSLNAAQPALSPRDFVLEKSVNGRDWVDEIVVTGSTGWTQNETRSFAAAA